MDEGALLGAWGVALQWIQLSARRPVSELVKERYLIEEGTAYEVCAVTRWGDFPGYVDMTHGTTGAALLSPRLGLGDTSESYSYEEAILPSPEPETNATGPDNPWEYCTWMGGPGVCAWDEWQWSYGGECKEMCVFSAGVLLAEGADCSGAPDCASLNRRACSQVENTCGGCLECFLDANGTAADGNTACYPVAAPDVLPAPTLTTDGVADAIGPAGATATTIRHRWWRAAIVVVA